MAPDTSGVHVRLVLWKAERAMEDVDRGSIEKLGLGLSDFAVLEMLLHKGPRREHKLGVRLPASADSIASRPAGVNNAPLPPRAQAFRRRDMAVAKSYYC